MPVIPVRETLKIYQGATYQKRWKYVTADGAVIDLTDYTARLQIRDDPEAPETHVDATTENGKMVISAEDGTIDLLVSATETSDLAFETAQYDLELIHPDGVTVDKLALGTVKLVREVTR